MMVETIWLALREIRRSLLRSSLTMLGIVIGVAAVIATVTLGTGATAQVTADIAKLGSNLLMVMPGQAPSGRGGTAMAARAFDLEDADAIEQEIAGVVAVAPSASRPTRAIYQNENWSTTVTGSNNAYLTVRDWTLDQGRTFTSAELRTGRAVCILGQTVKDALFGRQDPIGAQIRLETLACEVVGTLASKGQSGFGQDQDDVVLVPVTMLQRRVTGNRDVGTLFVSVRDGQTMKAQSDIERLLRERRGVSEGEADDFHVRDMEEITATVTGTTRVLTALLSAVAAVSLLVGGIGIMNIMLVSVIERTREIGIRLAIGAREREVLRQFLVEAVVLSSVGGLVGIVLALAGCYLAAPALGIPYVFDPSVVVIAFAFSAAVGVLFGYVPARRAAQLDPIEALRHE